MEAKAIVAYVVCDDTIKNLKSKSQIHSQRRWLWKNPIGVAPSARSTLILSLFFLDT